MEERKTVTITGPHILRKYNELKDKGYTTLWTGEGKICLTAPEHPTAKTAKTPDIFVNQPPPVLVLYEIDPDNDEANGIVHPFCSESCRIAKLSTKGAQAQGFTLQPGVSRFLEDQSVCEHCLKPINI